MDTVAIPLLILLLSEVVVFVAALFLLSSGDTQRIGIAFRSFGQALRDRTFAEEARKLLTQPTPQEVPPPKPSGAPLRLLGLLQREGRLLDFLLEDIQAYPDAQVGAAVRDIHRQCRAALQEHLELEPVLPQSEGTSVEIPAGFNPSAIRLTGNVTGRPPFRGTLQHHGWRVKALRLAPAPEGQDEFVLMPAEVELP